MIKGFDGINPTIDNSAFVAESADIIGDVVIEKDANIWYNTVLRGDANKIIVGENSNVQDGSIVHCGEESPTIIGKNVTIGHGAIIHGCNIGDYSLIGMGSIILNDAEIGEFTMVGAGSLVTSKKFPPGVLLLGSPAKVVRELTDKEKESLRISEFLLQFYIEKMLNLKNGKENVQFCKEIIKQGDIFSEILEDLNINKKEKHEIFIKCLKENINDYYMSSDMEDMKKSNKIIIATPYTYINANNGNIDFLINILKLNSLFSLNVNIISAETLNIYTGKYESVANIVINVNASTIPFWKFITNNILTKTDPNISEFIGVPVFSFIFPKNLGNTPSTPAA